MKREDVYRLIDGEREYQNSKPARPQDDDETPISSWIIYMRHTLNNAAERMYFLEPSAALEEIRKVAALAVACMENNETKAR